jgi:hypothetical protein
MLLFFVVSMEAAGRRRSSLAELGLKKEKLKRIHFAAPNEPSLWASLHE